MVSFLTSLPERKIRVIFTFIYFEFLIAKLLYKFVVKD